MERSDTIEHQKLSQLDILKVYQEFSVHKERLRQTYIKQRDVVDQKMARKFREMFDALPETRADIIRWAGYTPNYMDQLFGGHKTISPNAVMKIAEMYGAHKPFNGRRLKQVQKYR